MKYLGRKVVEANDRVKMQNVKGYSEMSPMTIFAEWEGMYKRTPLSHYTSKS